MLHHNEQETKFTFCIFPTIFLMINSKVWLHPDETYCIKYVAVAAQLP